MMECKKCNNEINCALSIHTEAEDMPIYTSYQWWECKSCGAKYFAILEDSKVNMFDDRLEHKGYHADPGTWQKTLDWALKCPKPQNESCKCDVHKEVPPSGFTGTSAWYTYD
jgi:hypothetical protein